MNVILSGAQRSRRILLGGEDPSAALGMTKREGE